MAQQGGMGQAGGRPITLESVAKTVVVAAIVVNLVNFVLFALETGFQPDFSPDLFQVLVGEVGDVLYHTALLGAVVVAYLRRQTRDSLAKLAGIVFGASVAASIYDTLVTSLLNPFSPSVDIVSLLFGGLTSAVFFLGFVMALRLFQGETVLPGVDYRL